MKNQQLLFLCLLLILIQCTTSRHALLNTDLSQDEIIIIGLIELDYNHLDNGDILQGIDLYLTSKTKNKNFHLPSKYIPRGKNKDFEFINVLGYKGDYDLIYSFNHSNSAEVDNFLTLLNMPRNSGSKTKKTLHKYSINDGKIINIGKIKVSYSGGNMIGGNIKYRYNLRSLSSDTTALYAFKQTYPEVYKKYQTEIYHFDNDVDKYFEQILRLKSKGEFEVRK